MATITGTDASDFLVGTADADLINGGLGNDTIRGLGGNDTLNGAEGDDDIDGGDGHDWLVGGDGDDTIQGGMNSDTIDGGAGNDILRGGKGHDSIDGGDGDDTIYSGLGQDTLTGGTGADVFVVRGADANFPGALLNSTITDFSLAEGDQIAIEGASAEDLVTILSSQTTANGGVQMTFGDAVINVNGATAMLTTANVGLVSEKVTPPSEIGSTFTLTTGSDEITGTGADDTITGAVNTLGSGDVIDGGGGNDTLTARIGTAASAPLISNVETINLIFRDGSANVTMTDITGATAVNVEGNTNGALLSLADASVIGVTNGFNKTLFTTFDDDSGTANSVTLDLNGASAFGLELGSTAVGNAGTAQIETLNLKVSQNFSGNGIWDIAGVDKIAITGDSDIVLNLNTALATAGGTAATALIADLTAIDASGLNGKLTLDIAGNNVNVTGGAGDDLFRFASSLNTSDTIDGGAGNDTLSAAIDGSTTVRPTMSNIETLNLDINTAGSVDLRNADTTLTTVTVSANHTAGAASVTDMNAVVTTLNLASANASSTLTFNYANGSDSDVTLNIGTVGTATAGIAATGLTISGNSGALTINSMGNATNSVGGIAANDVTAVVINAETKGFAFDGLTAGTALDVTVNAIGQAVNLGGNIIAGKATALTLAASGGTAAKIDFSSAAVTVTSANTITMRVDGTADATGISLTALNAGTALSLVDIDAVAGDVAVDVVNLGSASSAGTDVDFDINVAASRTFTLGDIEMGTAAAATPSATFILSGAGTVSLAGANLETGNVTISGTNLTGNLSANFNGSSAVFDVTLGNGTANFVWLGAGADTIIGGSGGDTILGGRGNDDITLGSGNDTVIVGQPLTGSALAATTLDTDTVNGASSGDTIVFALINTAGGTFFGGSGLSAGAITTGGTALASNTAGASAAFTTGLVQFGAVNLKSSGSDTIIEVVVNTAAVASADAFVTQSVTLQGITVTAATSVAISVGTAGLAVTLV